MIPDQMTELAARLRELARTFQSVVFSSTNTVPPIYTDLDSAADLIASMAQRVPQSVRERWNIERDKDGTLLVCFNEHEKGLGCRYERFVPESAQRVPLPGHEIVTMYAECPRSDAEMIEFARAIEQAHGIRSER